MKTILLAFLLTGAGLAAQTSAPPTFSPLPTPSSSGSSSARQPFYRVPGMGTNVAAQPAATVPPTNFASPFPKAQPGAVPATAAPTVPSSAPITRGPVTGPPPVVNPAQPPGATVPPVVAQPGTAHGGAPAEPMVQAGEINFPATDLNQVLQIYGELVGKTILRPTSLPAPTITLKTQTPLTRSEAIEAFKAVLWLNGIAVEDFGDKFVKVVPTANAGNVGAPFSTNAVDKMPEMGQFITHIVQLTNTKPSELVQVLQPLASPGVTAGIFPIDTSQILVLRDSTENVKRMLELIKKVDVTIPSEYISEVIPIKYAMATDLANALSSLGTGGSATTVGSAAGGGARGAGGYRPSYGGTGGYGGMGGYGGYPGSTMGGMMGTTPFGSITPQSVGGVTPLAINTPTTPGTQRPGTGSSFGDRLRNIINKASKEGEINVLGQTKIIADERTNSLLIFATREDMKIIKDIVSKLDVVLAQVLIEAAIVQVSLDDSHDFGVSYLQKSPSHPGNYVSGIGAINNNNILNGSSFSTSGAGTNIAGNLPSGFSYLASLNNDLDVSITALASSTRAKILQRPRIQTSHAVPATLFVGEQRPYPVSSYYGGGAFGGYASIQQLQIGVTIEVTPLINPDGLVVMDIHTKIDSFEGNVTIQNVGDVPVTSSKDATAKVAVRDHDTIMLGGLIETTKNNNNSGVPFLKDIPGLGYLFRSSSAEEQRTELIVLIRPTVLPTPEVAALAARAEKDRMPGVRSVEHEIQNEESKRLRDADKASKVKNQ